MVPSSAPARPLGKSGGVALLAILLAASLSRAAPLEGTHFEQRVLPLLKSYCFDCHGNGSKEGNLTLDQFATTDGALQDRPLWWKVLKNLRAGVMPPAGEKRPTKEELETIADWIKFGAFGIDPENPDPGRIGVRRLNRREYDNTVDDLLGIKFDAAIVFPPDDSGYGFDNVGDALSFSPLLMEKYLRAAQTIIDQTVPKVTWITPQQEFTGRDFQNEEGTQTGDRLSSKKPAHVKRSIQIDEPGTYDIHLTVRLHGTFDFDPSRYTITFTSDGQERSKHEYGWDENKPFRYQFTENWQKGNHELAFELTPLPAPPKAEEQYDGGFNRDPTDARFEVNSVRIEGPRGTTRLVHPRNYASFFSREQPPESPGERRQYAAEILRKFATRAFRSPVEPATIERLVNLAESVYQQRDKTFEAGVAHSLAAILASPRFLFRLESVGRQSESAPFSLIDEYALASRLSYFLWSTMPDEELFRLAESGELRKELPRQVQRMMRDDRAGEFVRNFAGQWLRTRDVTQVSIDPLVVLGYQEEYEKLREQFLSRRRTGQGFRRSTTRTPEEEAFRKRFGELREISDRFNDDMKRAMRRETEMCVEYVVQEDRSLLELLDCDYTFVNEKLAGLYEIPDVRGSEMRRVKLPAGNPRGGILTHASMLLVTSNPTRTSPVKRGLFVLENILGTPSPPPPAGVPDLEESAKKFSGREPPLRELLAAHRESALCSSCHSRMDPLGIALENFNALGMWRNQEKQQPIDASGQLITGESFQDVRDLKKILRERHAADFYRCVTEKMLTYALGRGLEATDEHTLDLIVHRLTENNGKFSALIQGVIESAPFQKQRQPGAVAALPRSSAQTVAAERNEP